MRRWLHSSMLHLLDVLLIAWAMMLIPLIMIFRQRWEHGCHASSRYNSTNFTFPHATQTKCFFRFFLYWWRTSLFTILYKWNHQPHGWTLRFLGFNTTFAILFSSLNSSLLIHTPFIHFWKLRSFKLLLFPFSLAIFLVWVILYQGLNQKSNQGLSKNWRIFFCRKIYELVIFSTWNWISLPSGSMTENSFFSKFLQFNHEA